MIERDIEPCLVRLFEQYPFVTVTGPRQSGKTTLCRQAFPHLAYVNLEAPDQREFAQSDPRGLLSGLERGAILDEIQRVPNLLSYLQVLADEKRQNSLFILTGSEHFKLSEAISQSLAGRTALLRLLPFTLSEREQTGVRGAIDEILYTGFYPRIFDQGLEPRQALGDYFETYVERDVRRLGEIRNVSSFQRFVRLCAGRIGQLTDMVSLGADAGVSHTTARNWLNILETSYIAFRLPSFRRNIRKRLVKSPKLYFYDVGLASYLIGIERAAQVATHPLRGALFENMVVVEALKYRFNRGRSANLSFYRDSRGLECDLLVETGLGMSAIEIKSGATIASDYFGSLKSVAKLIPDVSTKAVVYGGRVRQSRSAGEVVPFDELYDLLGRIEADREMAALVQDKIGPVPPEVDVNILDTVYYQHIRPTLDALEPSLAKDSARLFRDRRQSSFVAFGNNNVNSGSLLETGQWEQTKSRYIVKRGFRLSDERPLEITCKYTFEDYAGSGTGDFSLVASLTWSLGAEGVTRMVVIDEVSVSRLTTRVSYSDLSFRSARVDHTVAGILTAIAKQIESHSGPSEASKDKKGGGKQEQQRMLFNGNTGDAVE